MINNYDFDDRDIKSRGKSCNKITQKKPSDLSKHNFPFNLKKHEKLQKNYKIPKDIKEPLFHDNCQMTDHIISCEKEIKFLNSILSCFLDVNEIIKIKQKSYFNEENQDWVLPNFTVKQRKIIFPKLKKTQIKDIISNELKSRKIVFAKDDINEDYDREEAKFSLNNDPDVNLDIRPVTSFAGERCRKTGKPKDTSAKAIKKYIT